MDMYINEQRNAVAFYFDKGTLCIRLYFIFVSKNVKHLYVLINLYTIYFITRKPIVTYIPAENLKIYKSATLA